MTTLNTIIEEEKKLLRKRFTYERYPEGRRYLYDNEGQQSVDEVIIEDFLTTALQRAYEAGVQKARADWLRSEIEKLEKYKSEMKIPYQALRFAGGCPSCGQQANQDFIDNEFKEAVSQALTSIITRYKEELKELTGE